MPDGDEPPKFSIPVTVPVVGVFQCCENRITTGTVTGKKFGGLGRSGFDVAVDFQDADGEGYVGADAFVGEVDVCEGGDLFEAVVERVSVQVEAFGGAGGVAEAFDEYFEGGEEVHLFFAVVF